MFLTNEAHHTSVLDCAPPPTRIQLELRYCDLVRKRTAQQCEGRGNFARFLTCMLRTSQSHCEHLDFPRGSWTACDIRRGIDSVDSWIWSGNPAAASIKIIYKVANLHLFSRLDAYARNHEVHINRSLPCGPGVCLSHPKDLPACRTHGEVISCP